MRPMLTRRITTAAVALTLAGILGTTYLSGQTTRPGSIIIKTGETMPSVTAPDGRIMPVIISPIGGSTFPNIPGAFPALGSVTMSGTFTLAPPVPTSPQKLSLATERVVVFKDGYGLIIKTASATADADGKVFTTEVPNAAVLGTFWASSTSAGADAKKMLGMRAEWDESRTLRKTAVPCLTVRDILRANLGKRVTVTLSLGEKDEKRNVTGTVTKLLEEKLDPAAPAESAAMPIVRGAAYTFTPPTPTSPFDDPSWAGAMPEGGTLTRELPSKGGDFIVIENTEAGRLIVPVAQVQSVAGPDVITETTREEEVLTRTKRLAFDFGKESAGKPVSLRLFYFTPGLKWIPTYHLSGDLKDKADLALQGEILNDVEDIKGAALDLVVGVPNFRFKGDVSPLTLERQMRIALANISAGNNTLSNGNFLNSQFRQDDNRGFVDRGPPAAPAGPAELAGAAEQDLYIHSLPNFDLRKNARASVPLLQTTAPIRHLYTYDVKARRSRSTGGIIKGAQEDQASPLKISFNSIWHQLELKNDTTDPWTTGAALMMRGNLPIGQDLLTYTPVGGSTLLPVTVAIDLRGTTDEEEIERHANALHFDSWDYAQIRKKGTINITSYRSEKSAMRITLSTGGKVETASDDGKIKLNDFRPDDWDDTNYMRPNNHSDVTWEFDLEPGKTKALTYTVNSYIH